MHEERHTKPAAEAQDPYFNKIAQSSRWPWTKPAVKNGEYIGKEPRERVAGLVTLEFPVETLGWDSPLKFCANLSALPEIEERKWTVDLPTEAEWEYACRAGTTSAFHYGNIMSSVQANFDGDYPYGGGAKWSKLNRPQPVGSYLPNAWGLYDMHGNVFQLCKDVYKSDYYTNGPTKDPMSVGSVKARRVLRGGSWSSAGYECRSAFRSARLWSNLNSPVALTSEVSGFRVVIRLPSTPYELLAITEREAEAARPKTDAEEEERCVARAKNIFVALQSANGKTRREAIWAAGELGHRSRASAKDLMPALVASFADTNDLEAAVRALVLIGKPAVPELIKGLADKNSLVRLGSARALGRIGRDAQEAISVLEKAQSDSSFAVREAVENALKKVRK